MKSKEIGNIIKVPVGLALLLLMGSFSFASDKPEPLPGAVKTPTGISEDQKTMSNPANTNQTEQDNQAIKMSPSGSLTPHPFKMMDEKDNGG